jgi:hypothetical protein
MRLPGFTAQVSLPKTTTDYQVPDASLVRGGGQTVVPQYWEYQPSRLWLLCALYPASEICRYLNPPVEIPLTGVSDTG